MKDAFLTRGPDPPMLWPATLVPAASPAWPIPVRHGDPGLLAAGALRAGRHLRAAVHRRRGLRRPARDRPRGVPGARHPDHDAAGAVAVAAVALDAKSHYVSYIPRGTTAYLKTYRLSEKQVRRGHLLNQLASHDWHIAATARAMGVSEAELGIRMEQAGFGVLLRQDVLDRYRAQLRNR